MMKRLLICLIVLLCSPAWAAFTLVGTAGIANSSGYTATVTPTLTAGNQIIAIGAAWDAFADPVTPIAGGCDGDWQPLIFNQKILTSASSYMQMFLCRKALGGAQSITYTICTTADAHGTGCTTRGSTQVTLHVRWYSGGEQISSFDVSVWAKNIAMKPGASVTVAPENNGSLVVGCATWDATTLSNSVLTAGTGFGNRVTYPSSGNSSTYQAVSCSDKLNQASGSASVTPLASTTSANGLLEVVVLKPSGVPTGIQVHNRQQWNDLAYAGGNVTVSMHGVAAGPEGGNVSLIAVLRAMNDQGALTTIKEGASNNLTCSTHSPVVGSYSGTSWNLWICYLDGVSPGDHTITAAWASSGSHIEVSVYEAGGLANPSFELDTTAGSGTGTTVNTPSITTAGSKDLLIESVIVNYQVLYAGGGWTDGNISYAGNGDAYKTNQAAGTYAANYVVDTAGGWGSIMAAFQAAPTSNGSSRKRRVVVMQ